MDGTSTSRSPLDSGKVPKSPQNGTSVVSQARIILVICIVVTVGLLVIPYGRYIAYPLLLISTLVHELGHGVAAIMTGGEFVSFKMWWNGSGVAANIVYSPIASAIVAIGGLIGPAVAAGVFFVAARRPNSARYALGIFGALLVIALIFVVRNGMGFIVTGSLAAICLVIATRGSADLSQLALVFLAVQLSLSVYTRSDYLFVQYGNTTIGRMPSDVENISRAIGGPYWFWGAICAAISASVLIAGSWYFIRGEGARKPAS